MINNLIIIQGGAYNDIKKALRQWIELYSKDIEEGIVFQLFKKGRGLHLIKADNKLDNERFFYLINYLKYPENIQYDATVEGFTKGGSENVLKNKNLLVYISPTDNEYDNVLIATSENENFKVDFGGRIIKTAENKQYKLPTDLNLEFPETIKVKRKVIADKEQKNNNTEIEKRFRIISIIAVCLLIIGILIKQYDSYLFIKYSFFFGTGIGLWFFVDYKILQSKKLYFFCVGIAIGYLLFILIITGETSKQLIEYAALNSLTLLLIQKPTRLLYKTILNREPIVDRPPPTFWDAVYMIILVLGFLVLPFLIIDVVT